MKSFFSSLLGATLFVILLFFPGLVFEGAKTVSYTHLRAHET